MSFCCHTASLLCSFARVVFLPTFSLFAFPISSSRSCSLGARFQAALLFLSHPANPAPIVFFSSLFFCLMLYPKFSSPSSSLHAEQCRAQSTGMVCAVPLRCLPFCFLHCLLLIRTWKGNNNQRGCQGRRLYGHASGTREAEVMAGSLAYGAWTLLISFAALCKA